MRRRIMEFLLCTLFFASHIYAVPVFIREPDDYWKQQQDQLKEIKVWTTETQTVDYTQEPDDKKCVIYDDEDSDKKTQLHVDHYIGTTRYLFFDINITAGERVPSVMYLQCLKFMVRGDGKLFYECPGASRPNEYLKADVMPVEPTSEPTEEDFGGDRRQLGIGNEMSDEVSSYVVLAKRVFFEVDYDSDASDKVQLRCEGLAFGVCMGTGEFHAIYRCPRSSEQNVYLESDDPRFLGPLTPFYTVVAAAVSAAPPLPPSPPSSSPSPLSPAASDGQLQSQLQQRRIRSLHKVFSSQHEQQQDTERPFPKISRLTRGADEQQQDKQQPFPKISRSRREALGVLDKLLDKMKPRVNETLLPQFPDVKPDEVKTDQTQSPDVKPDEVKTDAPKQESEAKPEPAAA